MHIGTGTLFTRDDKQNRGTIQMPTFAGRSSIEFVHTGGISAEFYGWCVDIKDLVMFT